MSKTQVLNLAGQKEKLESELAHMKLVEALDQCDVNRGEIILAEYHHKGALGTTWFKVHRLSNGSGAISQPLSLSPQTIKLHGRDVLVTDVSRGRNPERLTSWFSPEALKLADRFTGRVRSV